MSEIITVGLDLAKNVFQVHGADDAGHAVLRKKLRRAQVLEFFGQLPPCVVAMEACGGAHFWAREICKLGHDVRLIPPAYVKPFVKRQKNDAADAEAICEAAARPTMRFVPVKSEETQGAAMVFRVRELLIRQRTQAITFSGTGAAIGYGENGREVSYPHVGRLRQNRHEELVAWSIEGGILQAGIAHKASGGKGRIRVNFLKMAGGTMRTMRGILDGTRLPDGGNMIHVVTMGAGLPTEEDAEICANAGVYLDPIISSVMALQVLLKRSFKKWQGRYDDLIGAVVYEDPWLAGGHNGPVTVLFRSFESNTCHQGDRIWQRYTATSSSVMRFAWREPVA